MVMLARAQSLLQPEAFPCPLSLVPIEVDRLPSRRYGGSELLTMTRQAGVNLAGAFLIGLAVAAAVSLTAQEPASEVADRPSFEEWLKGVRQEALTRGISAATVDRALVELQPLPIVLERDSNQVESKLSIESYVSRRVNREMVRTAKRQHARHATLLGRVSSRYGVPSSVIVAIWGLESNFGRFSGVRPIIAALATLAYDPRRSTLFREELFSALTILERGDIEPERLKGSWAGAMGQPQFLPSSYLDYAQDFDGDGRRDIWARARHLCVHCQLSRGHGWTKGKRWGREVRSDRPPCEPMAEWRRRARGCRAMRELSEPSTASRWRASRRTLSDGRPLPTRADVGSLVRPDTGGFSLRQLRGAPRLQLRPRLRARRRDPLGQNRLVGEASAFAWGLDGDRGDPDPASAKATASPPKLYAKAEGAPSDYSALLRWHECSMSVSQRSS